MNGPHDLGGQMGFGPVVPEPEAEPFHADWEGRALGLTLGAGALGYWTLDESRHARENLHPATYYTASYFEIWTRALENLLLRYALVTTDELVAGTAALAPAPHPKLQRVADAAQALARGGRCDRSVSGAPRFRPGEMVCARNMHPKGHTRLPRYVRGRIGRIESEHGGFVLPDSNAHAAGEAPERLYTVVFEGRELWGENAEPGVSISIDAWESYLEHA